MNGCKADKLRMGRNLGFRPHTPLHGHSVTRTMAHLSWSARQAPGTSVPKLTRKVPVRLPRGLTGGKILTHSKPGGFNAPRVP